MQQPSQMPKQEPGAPGQKPGAPAAKPSRSVPPPELDSAPIWKLDEPKLVAILKDPSSAMFQKAIACKRLAQVGTRACVQPVATLLADERLGTYARFALEPNPDPSVDEVLRDALPKLKGRLQMGVIHSLGVRKNAGALGALGKLMSDSDVGIAQAASASVGMIGGLQAAKLLRDALDRTKPPLFPVVARAALLCAEGLMASNRARALELYSDLGAKSMPQPVRLAALRVLNSAGPAPAGARAYPPPTA